VGTLFPFRQSIYQIFIGLYYLSGAPIRRVQRCCPNLQVFTSRLSSPPALSFILFSPASLPSTNHHCWGLPYCRCDDSRYVRAGEEFSHPIRVWDGYQTALVGSLPPDPQTFSSKKDDWVTSKALINECRSIWKNNYNISGWVLSGTNLVSRATWSIRLTCLMGDFRSDILLWPMKEWWCVMISNYSISTNRWGIDRDPSQILLSGLEVCRTERAPESGARDLRDESEGE
jgi:hypothetical protein